MDSLRDRAEKRSAVCEENTGKERREDAVGAPRPEKEATLPELFLTFAKLGIMTIGGGLTMLPLLEREIVAKRAWATEEELLDYYSISQITPGIIAVNTATFVGTKQRGTAGGIIATLGLVFPSVVIITVIAAILSDFAENPVVQNAFFGIRAAVCALMFNTVLKLLKKSVKGVVTGIVAGVTFLGMLFLDVSPIVFVLIAAAVGIVLPRLAKEGGTKK